MDPDEVDGLAQYRRSRRLWHELARMDVRPAEEAMLRASLGSPSSFGRMASIFDDYDAYDPGNQQMIADLLTYIPGQLLPMLDRATMAVSVEGRVPFIDVPLVDGSSLRLGDLGLHCLHTPGHAADHLVLYEPRYRILLTGDLIFVGKVGGTSNDADARTEWESLQRVLAEIPDDATIWPGHDYGIRPSSPVALERRTNPFLL